MALGINSRSTQVDTNTSLSLPLFVTRETKYVYGLLVGVFATVLYMSANHFPIFTPRMLPMTWVDRMVPFWPNTVLIYTSEYYFFWVAYILCKDTLNLNKYLYSFFTLQTLSVIIFFIWPTTYPRSHYPLPQDLNAFTYYIFSYLRSADAPTSCCPSLHVSSVFLTSFLYLDEQRGKFPFFFGWGALIALSTLTTKQHYLIDVVAGLMMAIVVWWFFHRVATYRPASDRSVANA